MSSPLNQAVLSSLLVIAALLLYLARFGSARRWVAVTLAACLLDQGIKAWLLRERFGPHWSLLGGYLRIDYTENRGLGFGGSTPYLLGSSITLAAALASLYVGLARRRYRMSSLTELGCALMTGGLLPILLDRIRLGFSVDFLEFGKTGDFTYNIADLAVFAGMALLAARILQFLVVRRCRRIGLYDPIDGDEASSGAASRAAGLWTAGIVIVAAVLLGLLWHFGRDQEARMSPLHRAILKGNAVAVERLLDRGADPNALAGDRTPLMRAAGSVRMVKVLLAHGARVNATNRYGMTALDWAVWRHHGNDGRVIEILAAHGARPRSAQEASGLLSEAVLCDNPRVVELAIKLGADPNRKSHSGIPPIVRACWRTDNARNTQVLLAAGADVNARDRFGKTALHHAAENGDAQMVKLLLAARARVNAKDNDGATPLHLVSGKVIWHGGAGKRRPRTAMSGADIAHALLENGADVNARCNDGRTPLICAAVRDDADRVKLLLARGAQVNAHGPRAWTALHYAVAKNCFRVAKALLAAGGDAGSKADDGATPVSLAKTKAMADLLGSHATTT